MTYLLKLLLYCAFLLTLNIGALKAEQSFEDAELVNEFITMSFSSSHPYDLRQTIPGEPEIDYPIYSEVPKTDFNCNGRHEGYYADIETRCQVFRICANTDLVGRGFAFLCPNGTLFSQKNFVCDWYRNVDCNNSEKFYSKNDNNRVGTKTDMMKTVRQMMEHPMKTINVVLNRGKPTTPQPTTYFSRGTSTTKAPRNFRTSSPRANKLPAQDTNQERKPITLDEVETASRFASPLQEIYPTQQTEQLISSPSDGGPRPSNVSTLTLTPPSPTFTPPFETLPSSEPYADESPLSPDNNAPYETNPSSNTNAEPTEDSTNEKDVYISSLGELSTDPGANFNRQTSRIIADPPSNSLETGPKLLNASGMNFAEKVNAGLNGQEIVTRGEVIAPEYVKNIMQQNVPVPDSFIQPPTFDFASNINSLLDEINYETELGGTNSLQYQEQNSAKEASATTKKPFRFLSRGFSHENPKTNGPYAYRQTTSAPRNAYRAAQDSSSTQSYRNSFLTTSLTTTPAPITLLETTQTSALDTNSEDFKIESEPKLNRKSEASLSQTQQGEIVLNEERKPSLSETSQNDKTVEIQSLKTPEAESELKSDTKTALKREQKELKQQEAVGPLNELPQKLDDENKADANKRAEDLLLAGVKQITVKDLDDKSKTTDEEDTSRIVPIYNRATGPETTTPHLTSSSTTSAISTTTTPKTTSTPMPSSTTISANTFASTLTSLASSTTSEPSTTPAVSIRRFTVGSGKRRQTSRPIVYSRRNNLPKSGTRTTTTTTTSKATTTTTPTFRGRSGRRTTSTTSTPSSTKITTSPRRRLNANRFTYGSRRRTTESTISTLSSSSSTTTTTTTTTVAPPSKKISVRSSDSSLSDLTAVASTYNAAPNRAYNSIRQGSYKYTQTQRRRPSHKNKTSATTTTKSPVKSTTTQQPRSSSSFPTPTLDPFSYNKAISPMLISSTTPEPLPATFLSFNDLTKSITDDSILQTLRKNQDFSRQLIEPKAFRSPQQASPIQQIPFSTVPRVQQGVSTQRPPLPKATTLPFIPLKDFIASKFGPQYSPEPPKLSTARPALITSGLNNGFSLQAQKNQVLNQQYTKQQYGIRQEYVPHVLANQAIKSLAPVQYPSGLSLENQNLFQAPVNNQQQQQQQQQQFQQQQYQQQLRLQQQQQQQQKLQQLKQQQNQLAQQYQIQQQQKLQQQQQQQQKVQQQQQMQQQQQKILQQQEQIQQQQKQVSPQQYFSTNQQQIFPNQQYVQQQFHQAQQVSTKIVPSVEQQFQIQRSQQIQQPQQQYQQHQQQSQIQIIPSQMTVAQTIPPQHPNINSNLNIQPEIGSINVRLPSNVAALIPNTNLFDSRVNGNSIERAQRRSDQSFEDAYGARERKSVYAGVSSYDVPLSSVGRLANDITNFLRQRRL